jgi:hypothetical protein
MRKVPLPRCPFAYLLYTLFVLTRWATTGSFSSVLRHRFLIASLIFLFSLGGLVNAFAHCILGNDFSTKISGQIPVSISCLDSKEHSFVAHVDQRDKRPHFSKVEKKLSDINHKASLAGETFYFISLRRPASIIVPLSVPIYQSKTVYQI